MVWEILVAERDVRALVPMAQTEELVNTAPLTGVPRRVPIRLVTVEMGGNVAEVTEQVGCESANTQVLQVSEACDEAFVEGKESRGGRGVRLDFWWRRLRASLRVTVWAPLLPLRVEMTDTSLEQVRGWRVPGPAAGAPAEPDEGGDEAERRARSCRLQYQRAAVRFLVPFVAHPADGGRHLTYLLGPDWLLDVSHLVAPHARVQDPRVATLEGGHVLVGREPPGAGGDVPGGPLAAVRLHPRGADSVRDGGQGLCAGAAGAASDGPLAGAAPGPCPPRGDHRHVLGTHGAPWLRTGSLLLAVAGLLGPQRGPRRAV